MKKVRNLVIGGIQQKVFNLVLITILLMMAAYTVVIIYQSRRLSTIVGETNELQRQSISDISQGTMDAVLDASFTDSTRMQAYIADDYFGDAAGAVRMLADYAEHLLTIRTLTDCARRPCRTRIWTARSAYSSSRSRARISRTLTFAQSLDSSGTWGT